MEFELHKHKVLTHQGIPAFKAGEWPGAVSSHWSEIGKRILVPVRKENILLGMEEEHPLPRGRKHFESRTSSEWQFKSGVKQIPDHLPPEERKRGLKKLEPNYTDEKFFFAKKHFERTFGSERSPIFHIKTFERSNQESSAEHSLENQINRKKRLTTLSEVRNYWEARSPGDKIYKNVEFSQKFFQEGGLAVGSTNKMRYNKTVGKKANNFYETLDLNIKSLDPNKLWDNKIYSEEYNSQNDYVKNLDVWNKTVLKEYLPKEEENPKDKVKGKPMVAQKKGGKK